MLTDRISVRETGAKGDGVKDDTTAIIRAMQKSRHIYLPAGHYLVGSPIPVPAHTRIEGAGRDSARIFDDGASHSFFLGTDTPGVEISHLTIEGNYQPGAIGNNSTSDAINFFGKDRMCSSYSVHDCRIRNMRGRGIVFVRHCSDVYVYNNIVENCSIGVFLFGGTAHGNTSNNVLRDCRVGGIYVDDATNNAVVGLDAFRPFYHTLHANQIVRAGFDPVQTGFGIGVSASHGVSITTNIIDSVGEPGVMASPGIIINSGQDDLFAMEHIAIGNNVITRCSGAGMFLEGVQNFSITGNTLVDNNQWLDDQGRAAEIHIRAHTKTSTPSTAGTIYGNLIRKTGAVVSRSSIGVNIADTLSTDIIIGTNAISGISTPTIPA